MRIDHSLFSLSSQSQALDLVQRSDGLRQAKDLALVQAEQAMEAALTMHPSPARDGLIKLASLVVNRTS